MFCRNEAVTRLDVSGNTRIPFYCLLMGFNNRDKDKDLCELFETHKDFITACPADALLHQIEDLSDDESDIM